MKNNENIYKGVEKVRKDDSGTKMGQSRLNGLEEKQKIGHS